MASAQVVDMNVKHKLQSFSGLQLPRCSFSIICMGSNHFLKEKSIFLNSLLKYGKNLLTHDYALQNHVPQNRKIENGEFENFYEDIILIRGQAIGIWDSFWN